MLARVIGGELVDAQGGIAHALGQVRANRLHHRIEIDVLVMVAHGGLGRGGEDRLGQLLGLAQAVGQFNAADLAGALVILPAAADEVAAGDGFHRYRLELAGHHGALGVQRGVHAVGQHAGHIDAGEVVGHQVRGLGEPEVRDLAEHFALAGDRIGKHHVEGRQTVGSDHQQVVPRRSAGGQPFARNVENITHLAAMAQGQAGEIGLQQRGRHGHSWGFVETAVQGTRRARRDSGRPSVKRVGPAVT